jgi:hypothetical protein
MNFQARVTAAIMLQLDGAISVVEERRCNCKFLDQKSTLLQNIFPGGLSMLIGPSSAWRFGEKPPELSTEHQPGLYIESYQILPIITSIESSWSLNY